MLELEQKSECCTKNEVWLRNLLVILSSLILLISITVSAIQVNNYKHPSSAEKPSFARFLFCDEKNTCAQGRCCCSRGGKICRDFVLQRGHEWIATMNSKLSGTCSWRTQGDVTHAGPGDWRHQIGVLRAKCKMNRKKTHAFRSCAESSGGQGKDMFWSPNRFVLSGWVVARCLWSTLLIRVDWSLWTCPASEVPRLATNETLKISKSIEFQQKMLQFEVWISKFYKNGSLFQASTAPPSSCMPCFERNDLRMKLWHCHLPSCFLWFHKERPFPFKVENIGSIGIMLESC